MDIGKERETIVVEPLVEPIPGSQPSPAPEPFEIDTSDLDALPEIPEPDREREKVPA